MMVALNHILKREFQIIAQIIKAEFIVCAIGHITLIGAATRIIIQSCDNTANTQTQIFINLSHPAGIAAGQIIIYCHHMNALARQRIQIDRQRRDQRFTLTCFHLGNAALMQDKPAYQLNIKMALPQCPARCLSDSGKGVYQQIIFALAGLQAFTKLFCHAFQGIITQRGKF